MSSFTTPYQYAFQGAAYYLRNAQKMADATRGWDLNWGRIDWQEKAITDELNRFRVELIKAKALAPDGASVGADLSKWTGLNGACPIVAGQPARVNARIARMLGFECQADLAEAA